MKRTVFTLLLGCMIVSASCQQQPVNESVSTTSAPAIRGVINQDDFIRAAEETVNGVVSVKSYATAQNNSAQGYGYDPLLEYFFGGRPERRQQPSQPQSRQIGLGSGVIISEDGYIVTNNHVIEQADRLEVTLNDKRNFPATVIGSDPTTDLALIKIEAPGLHVIPVADSEQLHVGEWVLAVGNPFGFTSSVTSGIVSAKGRNISSTVGARSNGIESYIQTDAAVNQGNSGGALVNLRGELVGINTAIYSQTGAYAGCSFAIPTSIVSKVVEDIKTYGRVQRAFLGISFVELSPELIAEKNLSGPTSGIYVATVEERSAAFEGGLEPGDIIVSLGGMPTGSTAELQEAIARRSPGDSVTIEYYRNGNRNTAQATLRNNRGDVSLTPSQGDNPLGATFKAVDAATMRRLGIRGGVEVNDIVAEGRMARAGMRNGFIIIGVNGRRISSPDELKAIYRAISTADASTEKVLFISGLYPTGKTDYYAVALDD